MKSKKSKRRHLLSRETKEPVCVAWISEAQSGSRIIRCEASQMSGFQLDAPMSAKSQTTIDPRDIFSTRFQTKVMRSKFTFSGLTKESVETSTGEDIFFYMLDIVETGNLEFFSENLYDIFERIPDGKYWIAQNIVSQKWKKRLFLGSIACASENEIERFIKELIETGDLRNFILCPAVELSCKFAVLISDEGSFFLYKKPA